MSTKNSSPSKLRREAARMARIMKGFERGEYPDPAFASRMRAAQSREAFVVGIVMDDKVIQLTVPWVVLRATGEVALTEYLFKQMREQQDDS